MAHEDTVGVSLSQQCLGRLQPEDSEDDTVPAHICSPSIMKAESVSGYAPSDENIPSDGGNTLLVIKSGRVIVFALPRSVSLLNYIQCMCVLYY